MPSPDDIAAVGYVLKVFPRLSETFIVNEIVAREAAGERVEIASLRPPNDGRFHAKLAQVAAPVCWINPDVRSASGLWRILAGARPQLERFDQVIDDLLAVDAAVAAQAVEVACWARDRNIDHLHAHFATLATTVTGLAARLTGLSWSFTAHAKDIFHQDVDEAALGQAIAKADHVVTVSDFNVADLRRRFPGVTTPIERIYNGLDPAEVPARCPAPSRDTIVSVGRLVEKKGFSTLIDALSILADRGPVPPVRIIGAGPLEADLRAQITAAGLDPVVQLLGPRSQDEVHRVMAEAAVFVAPCLTALDGDRDGLPTVVLEAMAIGTPVVATAVTGMGEAVIDGTTGRLAPERDPYALAAALVAALDDVEKSEMMAKEARAMVERRFHVRDQANALAGLRRRSAPKETIR